MHVQGERSGAGWACGVNFFEIVGAERVVPNGRGGIAGVTRAGPIVAAEKLFIDVEFFAHAVQTWS